MELSRNTSCSHGWLRVVMQYIFGLLTVASFVLIVLMSMGVNKPNRNPNRESTCQINGCRVACEDVPYYGNYEEDILFAVSEADPNCERVLLAINNPRFINGTIPKQWLMRVWANVEEIEIIGGNIQLIAPEAFLTPFGGRIRRLSFERITLMEWKQETLVGLQSIHELSFKDCHFIDIQRNALEAVDDSLNTLTITGSGYWNPTNVTGRSNPEKLTNVILSSNNFNNILDQSSFAAIGQCKVLFLNSCRISAVGPGTFDHFVSLQMLYLNGNFLVVFPSGTFSTIISLTNPTPRINLQDNLWFCDCSYTELRRLSSEGFLLIDPVCHYPPEVRGVPFSEFDKNCNESNSTRSNLILRSNISLSSGLENYVQMDSQCLSVEKTKQSYVKVITPVLVSACPINAVSSTELLPKLTMQARQNKNNDFLKATFTLKTNEYSIIEITATTSSGYGLLWYQAKCPQEIYCMNTLPSYLRIFNLDEDAEYSFCPLQLHSGVVLSDKCVHYSFLDDSRLKMSSLNGILFTLTVILCMFFGAACVYAIIRKFPYLLRGSNRILFVKNKNVDALILPPKVPLRATLTNVEYPVEFNNEIFVLSANKRMLADPFIRTKSIRSNKSCAPSYISVLQPTDEQLSQWRLRHHFNNDLTITSRVLEFPDSLFLDDSSMYATITSNETFDHFKDCELR